VLFLLFTITGSAVGLAADGLRGVSNGEEGPAVLDIDQFYTSWTWRKCRKAFAESKGNLCERCLSRGIINPGSKEQPLEVHHKVPLTNENVTNPKIALSWDNLVLICSECHHEEHRNRNKKRWKIGSDGRVILR